MVENASIQPGEYFVTFNTTATTRNSQQAIVSTATQKIKLGILGESAILTLLGVPSLLVLPGFLVTVTFISLWKLKPAKKIVFNVKEPEFWLIAISLSLIMILIYPPITALLTKWQLITGPRNYLAGYGVVDIVILWIVSILIGLVFYLLAFLVDNAIQRWKESMKFNGQESEIGLLNKLIYNKHSFICPIVEVKSKDYDKQGYLIEFKEVEKGKKAIICPLIGIEWLDIVETQKEEIVKLLNSKSFDEMKLLFELLKQAINHKNLALSWVQDDYLQKILCISDVTELKNLDNEGFILIIQ